MLVAKAKISDCQLEPTDNTRLIVTIYNSSPVATAVSVKATASLGGGDTRGMQLTPDDGDFGTIAPLERSTREFNLTATVHQQKLNRGRVVLDILLLLEVWGKPASITVLEPALVLMRNAAARKTFVAQTTVSREKVELRHEPRFITGLDIVYRGMVVNGAIRAVGENGYELANPDLLRQVSDVDRSNAKEVVKAIEALSDLRRLPEVVAGITNERYEVTV